MSTNMGLWIDHRKAIVVSMPDTQVVAKARIQGALKEHPMRQHRIRDLV